MKLPPPRCPCPPGGCPPARGRCRTGPSESQSRSPWKCSRLQRPSTAREEERQMNFQVSTWKSNRLASHVKQLPLSAPEPGAFASRTRWLCSGRVPRSSLLLTDPVNVLKWQVVVGLKEPSHFNLIFSFLENPDTYKNSRRAAAIVIWDPNSTFVYRTALSQIALVQNPVWVAKDSFPGVLDASRSVSWFTAFVFQFLLSLNDKYICLFKINANDTRRN